MVFVYAITLFTSFRLLKLSTSSSSLARSPLGTNITTGVNLPDVHSMFHVSLPARVSSGNYPIPEMKFVAHCARNEEIINRAIKDNTGIRNLITYLPIEYLLGSHCL